MKTVIFLLLVVTVSLTAQTKAKWSTTVELNIDGPPALRDAATSYLSREFRSVGDVRLVDSKPEYELDIVMIEVTTKTDRKTGWAMSMSLIWHRDATWITSMLDLPAKTNEVLNEYLSDSQKFLTHSLWTGGEGDLASACTDMVVNIDARIFERSRKAFNAALDKP